LIFNCRRAKVSITTDIYCGWQLIYMIIYFLIPFLRKSKLLLSIMTSLIVLSCGLGENTAKRNDNARMLNINLTGSLQNTAWSPNGDYLLFTRFRNGYNKEPSDLYIVNVETCETVLLVADGSANVNLPGSTWNPTTNMIVFSSSRDPHDEIFIIAADGEPGDEEKITGRADYQAYEPSFSPDGDFIVFESHVIDVEGDGKIVKKDLGQAPTAGFTDLTDPNPPADGDCRQPNWSPDGNLILYQRFAGGRWDIWVMNAADGSGKTQVTTDDGDSTDACFSPDSNEILYSADNGELEYANLYIIPVGGGIPQRLTFNNSGYDGAPSWSRDGTKAAFESCVGNPDGSSGTTICIIEIE
jgi:TolB protein